MATRTTGRGELVIRRSTVLRLLAALVLLACAAAAAQAAPSAQARAYIEARRGHVISSLNPLVARSSAGHNGKVVEWAGMLEPAAKAPAVSSSVRHAVPASAASPGPSSTPSTASAAASGPLSTASPASLPSPGPAASSPSPSAVVMRPAAGDESYSLLRTHGGDTFKVHVAGAGRWTPGKPVYVLARVVEVDGKVHHLNVLAIASSNDVTQANLEAMKKAAASGSGRIALRGGGYTGQGLSVNGAVSWIVSFNRGMDVGTAQALARSVLQSCAAYGVDPRLALSLFAAESAFRHDAVSSAGAQGLGQLMPGTAAMYGVRNPMNPFENADASIRHLGDLMARWRGSPSVVEFALAAYNAGAGAVDQYHGIPPYAETVAYVKTILGYYRELSRYP